MFGSWPSILTSAVVRAIPWVSARRSQASSTSAEGGSWYWEGSLCGQKDPLAFWVVRVMGILSNIGALRVLETTKEDIFMGEEVLFLQYELVILTKRLSTFISILLVSLRERK